MIYFFTAIIQPNFTKYLRQHESFAACVSLAPNVKNSAS